MLWWLSFVSPDKPKGERFLGVCIIEASCGGMEGMKEALLKSHRCGCNPGGEVQGSEAVEPMRPIPADRLPVLLRTLDEARSFEREFWE